MSQAFERPRLAWTDTFQRLSTPRLVPTRELPHESGRTRAVSGATPRRSATARLRSSHRLPAALVLTAATAAVVAVALLRSAQPLVVVAALVVTTYRAGRTPAPMGAPPSAAAVAAGRPLLLAAGAAVVGLHLANLPRRLLDDVLALGAAAAVSAAAAAALAAYGSRTPRVVVVGDLAPVRGLVARWLEDGKSHVVGAAALDSSPEGEATGLPDLGVASVGGLDEVVDFVDRHDVDLVVMVPGQSAGADQLARLCWGLKGSRARLAVTGVTDQVAPHRIAVGALAGATMAVVRHPGAGRGGALVKALVDRVGGMLLALVALPVIAVAAAAVRLDSPGPAFFTQTRVGRDGRLFTIYKLRTMCVDAERVKAALATLDEGNGILFKIAEDPRTTRIGRLLRRTSIDELPQLLNVLKGEMSLVGPRPALPEEVARYTEDERRRLAVLPGLTGPWQVSGRSALSRRTSMHLDISYADNWRPSGDGLILLRTLPAVLSRRGAC